MKLASACALLGLSSVCLAGEIPEAVIPAGVGVNIHFVTGHERDLDLIAEAGFKFIRMDFGWTATEPAKGKYDRSAYEQLLANLDKRGIRALFILDYSHHLYEEEVSSAHPFTGAAHKTTASPQHPESIAAYARWAAAAATHFKGRHVIWEIWNEPNIQFWAPKPDAQQYTALALAAARAIREADPAATIIGPASSGFPWEFLETFLKSGVLQDLDAISIHPYRSPNKPPETATADYERLRELISRYKPADRPQIPILSGEWGYSSHTKGASQQNQAAFAIRQQLNNLLNGVPLSIWYDWKNDGDDPNENEHNFGTVTSDLKPKPAYQAFKVFTHQLAGFRIQKRLKLESEKDYVVLCSSGGGRSKLAAWTLDSPHSVRVGLKGKLAGELPGVAGDGKKFSSRIESGQMSIELQNQPQFIDLGETVLSE